MVAVVGLAVVQARAAAVAAVLGLQVLAVMRQGRRQAQQAVTVELREH
jgi:hypothetical protein